MDTHGTVGFTGTQNGMTHAQRGAVWDLLLPYVKGGEFHHGMCDGSDEQASSIAHRIGWYVVGHPGHGTDKQPRYFGYADQTLVSQPFLVRNHHIVDACDVIIATPAGTEVRRSGTWATVRYAKSRGKGLVIIHPDGRIL